MIQRRIKNLRSKPVARAPLMNLSRLQFKNHRYKAFNSRMINTRTAGVAVSLQWPAAVILTASPKTHFYWYMRGVVAT